MFFRDSFLQWDVFANLVGRAGAGTFYFRDFPVMSFFVGWLVGGGFVFHGMRVAALPSFLLAASGCRFFLLSFKNESTVLELMA